MLFRVLFLLGIKDPHRAYFWKLLAWTAVNKRKYLDQAFLYSVIIYQMHQTHLHIAADVRKEMMKEETDPLRNNETPPKDIKIPEKESVAS